MPRCSGAENFLCNLLLQPFLCNLFVHKHYAAVQLRWNFLCNLTLWLCVDLGHTTSFLMQRSDEGMHFRLLALISSVSEVAKGKLDESDAKRNTEKERTRRYSPIHSVGKKELYDIKC